MARACKVCLRKPCAPDCQKGDRRPSNHAKVASLFEDQVNILQKHIQRHLGKIQNTTLWNEEDAKSAKGLSQQVVSIGNLWLKIQKAEAEVMTNMTIEEKLNHMKKFVLSLADLNTKEKFADEIAHALGFKLEKALP